MELKATRFAIDGPVATIWLHRPHRHNAWTGRMHAEYRWLLGEVERDPTVRAVVVTGTPPAFCVGGDSDALAGHAERGSYDDGLGDGAPGNATEPPVVDLPDALDADFAFQLAMRVPVIAAVNGAAAGVGLAVALFADLRFAAAAAKLTTAAPKLGLPAEYGMSWMLPQLVGLARANDLLLSGRVVTAADTESWGLWNGVLADGAAAFDAATEYARLQDRRRWRTRSDRSPRTSCAMIRRPQSRIRWRCFVRPPAPPNTVKVSPRCASAVHPTSADVRPACGPPAAARSLEWRP